jgi:hypothetical protein
LYESVSCVCHARSRQRWLSSVSLDGDASLVANFKDQDEVGNFCMGLLALDLGVETIWRGHIGQLWFPEISASGWAARFVGLVWLIVATICFAGSYKKSDTKDDDGDSKV